MDTTTTKVRAIRWIRWICIRCTFYGNSTLSIFSPITSTFLHPTAYSITAKNKARTAKEIDSAMSEPLVLTKIGAPQISLTNGHLSYTNVGSQNAVQYYLDGKEWDAKLDKWHGRVAWASEEALFEACQRTHTPLDCVNIDHASAEQLAAYEAAPAVLAPWDPMGSLAE